MNEVVIPLKMTGIAQMKAELKELKSGIANATDPAQMAALAQKAGVLTDKIKDANEAVKVFATGSKFEQVSNGLGGIRNSLMSLDFEEAAAKSKVFATALGGIGKADIAKSFKGIADMVGTLSKAFLKLGVTILMNPIFLIVAAVVAIIAVVALILKSFGVLDDVINAIMAPIYALIQGFKDLTDWLGLTAFAAEDNAAKTIAANDKVAASSKERAASVTADLGREIAEAKAAGEDTTKLEERKSNVQINEAGKRRGYAYKAIAAQRKLGEDADQATIKRLHDQINEETQIIKNGYSEKRVAKLTDIKADADANAAAAKENAAKAKEYAANRLNASREIKKQEIALAGSDMEQERLTIINDHKVKIEDIKKNAALTAAEKIRFQKLEDDLFILAKEEFAVKQKAIDKANKVDAAEKSKLFQENIQKEIAAQDAKFLEIQRLKLSDVEFEKLLQQQVFDEKTAKLKDDDELYLLYKQEFQQKLDDIDTGALEKFKANEAAKRAEQFDTAQQNLDTASMALNSISLLVNFSQEAKLKGLKKGSKEEEIVLKKQFKLNKAMQLAGAIIDAGKAITASLASAPIAIGPIPNPAGIASLAFAAVTSAVNIAKIASTQFTSTSAPSTDAPGNIGEATTAVAPAAGPQLFGQANTGSQVNAGGNASNNITVTAVVSETEITASQSHINNIQQNSVL